MLVLTRKPSQSIMVGDDIVLTVLEVRGDKVRIGIDAPRNVAVHRQEVYEQIQLQNIEAARAKVASLEEVTKLVKKKE